MTNKVENCLNKLFSVTSSYSLSLESPAYVVRFIWWSGTRKVFYETNDADACRELISPHENICEGRLFLIANFKLFTLASNCKNSLLIRAAKIYMIAFTSYSYCISWDDHRSYKSVNFDDFILVPFRSAKYPSPGWVINNETERNDARNLN